jgi:hypothetical protein
MKIIDHNNVAGYPREEMTVASLIVGTAFLRLKKS